MAETLLTLSTIAFVVAGIFFILAVFFWFLFKIPSVISDLSGRTAKKSIEKLRRRNEQTGSKGYRVSQTNAERGKLTSKESATISGANKKKRENLRPETGMLQENQENGYTTNETTSMTGDMTERLDNGMHGVYDPEEATAPLKEVSMKERSADQLTGNFVMLEEVLIIHTDEVI